MRCASAARWKPPSAAPTHPHDPGIDAFEAARRPEAAGAMMTVAIAGGDWLLDGRPTCPGRVWRGRRIQGLLLNSRMAWGNYRDGYRNPPIDWRIATPRKRAFFSALKEAAGS